MERLILVAVLAALAGCGSISDQLDARSRACSAQGGVLTGMGCEGGGGIASSSPALPGRIDTAPAFDRNGQPNYDDQGRYVGAHGVGSLVDRPPGDGAPSAPGPQPMPANVVYTKNAAGNAGACTSQ